jgi:RNA polymerase sigma-70 factor, ECF subfamily
MAGEARGDVEDRLRAYCFAGRADEAAKLALSVHGPEIMSYLVAMLRDEDASAEAFSIFVTGLWRGLPRFRWECSFRTWSYVLARRAQIAVVRERSRRRREVRLSHEIDRLAQRIRTETLEYLRTGARDRLARLRDELAPDDQALLVLRVDRNLSWPDIARVMSDADEADSAEAVARLAATLRKRFERVKERLRRLAATLVAAALIFVATAARAETTAAGRGDDDDSASHLAIAPTTSPQRGGVHAKT